MIYIVNTTPQFDKEFKKLDKYTQRMLGLIKILKIALILVSMEKD